MPFLVLPGRVETYVWYVGDKCVNRFCTAWRKGLRRIWNLLYDAHCDIVTGLSGGMSIFDELCKRSLNFVTTCLCHSSEFIRFIMSYGINFATGVSLVGKNVAFSSARYNFKICDFISGVINVTRAIQQYCRSATSESNKRVCQFVLDMIRCRDWYGSDECILDRDEICQIMKFLAAG